MFYIRLKGISKPVIKAIANKVFEGDVFALYRYLYDHSDKNIAFNLAEGKPSFELDKTMRVFSRKEFIREISIPASIRRLEYNHQ